MSAPTTYTEYALQLATDPQAKKDRMLGMTVRVMIEEGAYSERELINAMSAIDDAVDLCSAGYIQEPI